MTPYKTAIVLGLGSSGEAAARLLISEGTHVTVIDETDNEYSQSRASRARAAGADVMLAAAHVPAGNFDVAIVSPGLSLNHPWLTSLRSCGVPLVSELELGWSRRNAPVIAITGSNGKSTATKMIVSAIREAGLSVEPAGNYGPPVCAVVSNHSLLDWLVIEVSSFQLETCTAFKPEIGVLLNILPNHLDRHGDMDAYAGMKAKLFAQMTDHDSCLVPFAEQERVARLSGREGRWVTFGEEADAGICLHEGVVYRAGVPLVDLNDTPYRRAPYGLTAAAAAAAASMTGIQTSRIQAALQNYVALPHRLQTVKECHGVTCVNDSKSTNLAATRAALSSMQGQVRLIAGGRPKEKEWSAIKELLVEKASAVYLIGEAASDMAAAWSADVACRMSGTLEAAVQQAWGEAQAGDTILLSPACASFDQFSSYEERGRFFSELVTKLAEEEIPWETKCLGNR